MGVTEPIGLFQKWNKGRNLIVLCDQCARLIPEMGTFSFSELRRSTRVPLEVSITIEDENVTANGVTIVVNLHGALIRSSRQFEI
jgi:hypothetical protein